MKNLVLNACMSINLIVMVAGQVSYVEASAPSLTAAQITKIKSTYTIVSTADTKAMNAVRAAINGSNVNLEYAANEAVFSAAAKNINEWSRLFYYAYQNDIHEDETVKLALDCLAHVEFKQRDLIEKIFDNDIYFLDPVDDADTIEDEIFGGFSIDEQSKTCGQLEVVLKLR
jgi:hypothetical protein